LIRVQEQEAREAQQELERRMEEARIREAESYRLQEELTQARLQMEENQRALQEALSAPRGVITVIEHEGGGEEDDRTSEQSIFIYLLFKN